VPKGQDYALTGTSAPGPQHLAWEPLTPALHATIPKPSRVCVRWLKAMDKKVVHFVFWLAEPGRAVALDPEIYLPRIAAIMDGDDRHLRERVIKLAFRGKWDGNSEIVIPDPVAAYVNGNTAHPGVWIWATRNRFELWGDGFQQAATARAALKRLPSRL
jgi:hypothetical protein